MSCLACLLAFLAALVFGQPGLDRTLRLDVGSQGTCLSLVRDEAAVESGFQLGLARLCLDSERGIRVELKV